MLLTKEKTIAVIQEEFNTTFPGLRLAFYQKKHADHKGSAKDSEYDIYLSLGEIQPTLTEATLNLDASKTVAQFEQEVEDQFGLHVQVFRRSNDLWLQTIATDDWTLEVQNRKGLHSVQA